MGRDDEDAVGVGPYEKPWPDDPRLSPELLAGGDRRNVIDRYRYWTVESIVADLDRLRHPFHVAAENWQRDPNLGALVRNANAFGAAAVHIVGKRRWNRRGAMMTELYTPIRHHDALDDLVAWARAGDLPVLGVDNLRGATSLVDVELPRRCVLLFGQEGPGLSSDARTACERLIAIDQYGSTRSINAGAASAVVMYEWCRRHATR
jgi:tRNA G18 (ribose-2'-O)-methylase SpoU